MLVALFVSNVGRLSVVGTMVMVTLVALMATSMVLVLVIMVA